MTKGVSERVVREALNNMGLSMLMYKPPDDARNWKPADFLVWVRLGANAASNFGAFVEVKDTPRVDAWPLSDLRLAQRAWIGEAAKKGIRYWIAIHWARHKNWTVVDGAELLRWEAEQEAKPTSVPRRVLTSRLGVECEGRLLAPTLKAALLGDLL